MSREPIAVHPLFDRAARTREGEVVEHDEVDLSRAEPLAVPPCIRCVHPARPHDWAAGVVAFGAGGVAVPDELTVERLKLDGELAHSEREQHGRFEAERAMHVDDATLSAHVDGSGRIDHHA